MRASDVDEMIFTDVDQPVKNYLGNNGSAFASFTRERSYTLRLLIYPISLLSDHFAHKVNQPTLLMNCAHFVAFPSAGVVVQRKLSKAAASLACPALFG